MVDLTDIVSYANDLLTIDRIDDYCPNGLQIEGKRSVERIVSGVTASQDLIDEAVHRKADILLVHHGYFWKNEDARIVGIKKQRIEKLLANEISLLAYHLPLDVHPLYGNNIQLAKVFGWEPEEIKSDDEMLPLVRTALLDRAWNGADLAAHIGQCLQRSPLHIKAERPIHRVAWCTGAAQAEIATAVALGVDAYITGEVSEPTVHEAREYGIHFFAAGHHATERYGVQALGEIIAKQFNIDCQFVDCDNPV